MTIEDSINSYLYIGVTTDLDIKIITDNNNNELLILIIKWTCKI